MSIALLDRSFILIKGDGHRKFLQGLLTQDIFAVTQEQPLYSLMLNAAGRFVFELFICTITDVETIIEVPTEDLADIVTRLKAYAFRSNIEINIKDNWQVIASKNEEDIDCDYKFKDPRHELLGWRYYGNFDLQKLSNILNQHDFDYRYHRMSLGVPDHNDMIKEKSIPLECLMEEVGAISFNKGCYLGQELTSRTKHTGVVRKKLILKNIKEIPPENNYESLEGQVVSYYKDLAFIKQRIT